MQHSQRQHRGRVIGSVMAAAALVAAGLTALGAGSAQAATARQVEALDRGVVSVHTDSGNLVSWRWLGYTGNTIVDGVTLDGTRLWRVDLGRNIRSGAHYTQFQVYDYDGDGKAEVAMKTADGTTDGRGTVIGGSSADYRNFSGYVLSGPEYLTMFNGRTTVTRATDNTVGRRANALLRIPLVRGRRRRCQL